MSYIDQLKSMTAWEIAPELSEDDLTAALGRAAVRDASGLEPKDEDWIETYDLNTAAAAAWLIKAGRAAAIVDEPTAGVVTSRIFENCRTMAGIYAAKRRSTVTVV